MSETPLLKALVAFANTAGGRLVIGIVDDRSIVGVEKPLGEGAAVPPECEQHRSRPAIQQ